MSHSRNMTEDIHKKKKKPLQPEKKKIWAFKVSLKDNTTKGWWNRNRIEWWPASTRVVTGKHMSWTFFFLVNQASIILITTWGKLKEHTLSKTGQKKQLPLPTDVCHKQTDDVTQQLHTSQLCLAHVHRDRHSTCSIRHARALLRLHFTCSVIATSEQYQQITTQWTMATTDLATS